MAEHNVVFEIYYDSAWHQAPLLTRDRVTIMRGTKNLTNDTDPASASGTIDNTSGLYAPKSAASALYGKIGQNTKSRITVDGDARLTAEVASWQPQRPIKGSGYTPVDLAGVLQRLGRGTDKLHSPLRRAFETNATAPVAYWPLEENKGAAVAYDTITGAPSTVGGFAFTSGTAGAAQFGVADLGKGSALAANIAGGWNLDLTVPSGVTATGQVSLVWVFAFGTTVRTGTYAKNGIRLDPRVAPKHLAWSVYVNDSGLIEVQWLEADSAFGLAAGPTTVYSAGSENIFDGQPRVLQLDLAASGGTNVAWHLYENDVSLGSGTVTPSFSGAMNAPPYRAALLSTAGADQLAAAGHVAIYNTNVTPARYAAALAHVGEYAADRFTRFCTERGLTATVIGTASESMSMGPQGNDPSLDQLDEIARTDDASIFETKDALGLTMRTGASKLAQDTALSISYIGQVQPPLLPVFGDANIRNDVTAKNPDGLTAHVVQETGPHNVQLPEDDPQGVGRYTTSIDVNGEDLQSLLDAAGWRVNLGTYDGTWYAEVTIDLDAAPGLITAANAVEIGDVVAITDLPKDDTVGTFYGIVLGIKDDLPPKRRLLTFYLAAADPYRVGVLATTTGDTNPIIGYAESDSATVHAAAAAGASSFTVDAVPVWTTDADDFPQDVVVGGQRVTIGSVTGSSAPQTFNVRSAALGGRQILYPIPAGADVSVYQPLILTL